MSKIFWRAIKKPPVLFYAIGLGPIIGRLVLLLTTIGRKSGLPRVTPLQYEEVEGNIHIASARGIQADWFRNILVNPRVVVHVGSKRFNGLADPITDPARIAEFLEIRFARHPRMMGALLRLEGLPKEFNRARLEEFAVNRAMVVIRPDVFGV
jgi:deazaflavin-dependent oxidoreductase (nitroreductase family)